MIQVENWSILNEARRRPSDASMSDGSQILIQATPQPTVNTDKDDTRQTSMSQDVICDEAETGNAAKHYFEPTGSATQGDKSQSILNEAHRQPSDASMNDSGRILIYATTPPTGNTSKEDTKWTIKSQNAI